MALNIYSAPPCLDIYPREMKHVAIKRLIKQLYLQGPKQTILKPTSRIINKL
jgi:hypothetical protein